MKFLWISLFFSLTCFAQSQFFIQVKKTPKSLRVIKQNSLDVLGVSVVDETIDLLVDDKEYELFTKELVYTVPKLLLKGPDPRYYSPEKVEAELKSLALRFPHLTQLEKVGESIEGRSIWAMKVSDNAQVQEYHEPAILFNSMHHAREVMTPEMTMSMLNYLLESYDTNPQVTHWVNANEIWVLPMLNVDGNERVWNRDSFWRKNLRGGYGVDINRNYPLTWDKCGGSSSSKWSQTYRGESAGSEPETKAMMDLVARTKPVFNISYHSYSQLVLYPLGCKKERTKNFALVEGIGVELAKKLDYEPGTPWEVLYEVDGGDVDWMYLAHQVIPYVLEVNSGRQGGFHPDYDEWRDVTVERVKKGWSFLLDRLDGAGVRGEVVWEKTGPWAIDIFEGEELIDSYQVNHNGWFHIVLNPGKYRLVLKNDLTSLAEREVEINEKRVDFNFVKD